ncbi:MAG: FAD-dependent oxidoreductase [Rubrobacteraceae bacterium]
MDDSKEQRGDRPAPVDDFPDPDDLALFPRLSGSQLQKVAARAGRRELGTGDLLFDQGQRDAPFYVVEEGSVDFYDTRPGDERYFAKCKAGTFVGDTAIFTGEPTVASCVAAEPCRVLMMSREELRRLVAEHPDVGDLILQTMTARREWLEGYGYGQVRLIGSRFSREAFELRNFLSRNRIPNRWHDIENDEESQVLLEGLGVRPEETPVLVRTQGVMRHPTLTDVAHELGLRATVEPEPYDLVVLGAGPAGLAASVYAASEGLNTLALDAYAPGGQAGTSSRIENYLGFPTGLSGDELAERATLQARKFGAVLSSLHGFRNLEAAGGDEDGPNEQLKTLELEDGQTLRARAVIIATGAEYRRLPAEGAEDFEGSGVYYAATYAEALQCAGDEVVVVGGGNSAGQAALNLARHARRVYLVVRRDSLVETMSRYLTDRIERNADIELVTNSELSAFHGEDGRMSAVTTVDSRDGTERTLEPRAVFAMIGAVPRTETLKGVVGLDERGFVVTGEDASRHPDFGRHWTDVRQPYLLETTRPGVFAAGDARSGSTKRVASAVGEGSMVVTYVHRVLASSL